MSLEMEMVTQVANIIDPDGSIHAKAKIDNDNETFIELGQGMYSLDIDNPYDQSWKRWIALTYLSFLLIMSLITLLSRWYILTLISTLTNFVVFILISLHCIKSYYYIPFEDFEKSSTATHQYVAPVLREFSKFSKLQLQRFDDNKNINESARMDAAAKHKCFNMVNTAICRTFYLNPQQLKFSFCPKHIGILILSYSLFANIVYFGTFMSFQDTFCPKYVLTACTYGYYNAYIMDAIPLYILFLIAFAISNLAVKSRDTERKLQEFKKIVLNRYECMENTENRIQTNVCRDMNKLKLSTSLYTCQWIGFGYVILWVLISAVLLYAGTTFAFSSISQQQIWRSLGLSLVLGFYFLILINSFRKLIIISRYPHTILNVFAEPLYCNESNQVIGWWQLRHYYKVYDIPTTIGNLSFICGMLLFVSILLVGILTVGLFSGQLQQWDVTTLSLICVLVIVVIIVIGITFDELSTAFNTTQSQISMLEKEKLRLAVLKNMDGDQKKDVLNVIEIIITRLLKHDKPFTILSIPITSATLLAIRGFMISLCIIVFTEVIIG